MYCFLNWTFRWNTWISSDKSWTDNLSIIVSYVNRLTILSILAFLTSLTYSATVVLSFLNQNCVHQLVAGKRDQKIIDLQCWRKSHLLFLQLIELLNKCLGLLFLIIFTTNFVTVVLDIFYWYDSPPDYIKYSFFYIHIYNSSNHLFQFLLIIFIPAKLQFTVRYFYITLNMILCFIRPFHFLQADEIRLNLLELSLSESLITDDNGEERLSEDISMLIQVC